MIETANRYRRSDGFRPLERHGQHPLLRPRVITVTPRQNAVLQELIKDGADNATIARRLRIERDTVKSHVRDLLARFEVSNRAAVVCEVFHGRVRVEVVDQNKARHR